MKQPRLIKIIECTIIILVLSFSSSEVLAQKIIISNSVGAKYMYNKSKAIGPMAGTSIAHPINDYIDVGIGFQFAINSLSPHSDQLVLNADLNKISHFKQNELSLFANMTIIAKSQYLLKLRSGFLYNNYSESFVMKDYFIDPESGLKAYASDINIGENFGFNVSIVNEANVSKKISLSFISGINFYRKNKYNSLNGECVITYKPFR